MKLALTYILILITYACYGETTKVAKVIDGDTFETLTGEKVRLIGINAPEITDIFGIEAKQYLSELIENKTVELQIDDKSKNHDFYQRLLRYVNLEGQDINKKMISDGFAFAYLKYQFSKSEEYKKAQIEAKESNKGIWEISDRKNTIEENGIEKSFLLHDFSIKSIFVSSLILILIFVGLYNFYKK